MHQPDLLVLWRSPAIAGAPRDGFPNEAREAKHEEERQELIEKQHQELQDLESANNQKLMAEYEKYQELQAKSQRMQEEYERQLAAKSESHKQALREQTEQVSVN